MVEVLPAGVKMESEKTSHQGSVVSHETKGPKGKKRLLGSFHLACVATAVRLC